MPLYKISLKESLESQKATVILFATPAFCKTGTCGPQLDVIKDLSNEVFETMGDGVKKIEENEENAFIVQRRSIVCNKSLKKGAILKKEDLNFLRPCPIDSFHPYEVNSLIGKKLSINKKKNESILKKDIC